MGCAGRHAVVVVACALVACGLTVAGSKELPPAPVDAATEASTPSAPATVIDGGITDVPIGDTADAESPPPEDAATDASDAEAGPACGADGTSCTSASAASCCNKGCNVYDRCHACSSSSSTECTSSSQCCTSTFCGRPANTAGAFHCLACLQRQYQCSSSAPYTCCSGKCSYAYSTLFGAVYACE